MIRYLLRQQRPRNVAVAEAMDTSVARGSRIVHGRSDPTEEEFQRVAHLLALGQRPDDPDALPRWVATRWHADATIEPPPLTSDGRLPVFVNYGEARAVAAYLREFPRTGSPVAVPVWPAFVDATLADRGIDRDA